MSFLHLQCSWSGYQVTMTVVGNQLHRGTMPDGGGAGTTVYINNYSISLLRAAQRQSSRGKSAASL